jgi:SAM-dependent methyltransferase
MSKKTTTITEPLSFLVKYRANILGLSTTKKHTKLLTELKSMLCLLDDAVFTRRLGEQDLNAVAKRQVEIISEELIKFEDILDDFKATTDGFLRKEEKRYLRQSYKAYEESKKQDNSIYILKRSLYNSLIYKDNITQDFITLINKHSSWKYPGLFIRPEHGKYVSHMTASDPLYIMDETSDLMYPVKKLWNKEYKSRIRYNLINERRGEMFCKLPNNQFGLIIAMNFLNHKPLEIMKKYLKEIWTLLRPGGIFIFTYNNCNLPLAVRNFEQSLYSYTPETLVSPLVSMLGFEIINSYNAPAENVSWLELKKPGVRGTLRGGQCLGKIQYKK